MRFKAFAPLALLLIFMTPMKKHSPVTYLALGDSYTIGQSIPHEQNFPNQAVQLLRARQMGMEGDGVQQFTDPTIIAQTGWTTSDLADAMSATKLEKKYDFVTLLIGVNNQYMDLPVKEYEREFSQLIRRAITLAGNDPSHVIVLSIPDWSVTPFATASLPDGHGRDREKIAAQLGVYNASCKTIASRYHLPYIDITEGTLKAASDPSLLAADGLHPSAKEYTIWAARLADMIGSKL